MNRRNALMLLLVISLVAGPFLFIVPSAYAGKDKPPEVIVVFEGAPLDPTDPDFPTYEYVQEDFPFPDEIGGTAITQLPKTYIYNVEVSNVKYYGDPNNPEQGIVYVLLLIPNRFQSKYDELHDALGVIQFGVPADVNNDGQVTGADISIIANANAQPDLYDWELDLAAPWGVITNEDVNFANTYKGQQEDWIDLGIGEWEYMEEWASWYLQIQVDHFSRFGMKYQ